MARAASKRLLFAVLLTGQVTVVLNATIVNVALPAIQDDLGMGAGTLQYVVTVYSALLGGFLLFAGRSADLFGRRAMLMLGLAGFTVASGVVTIAPTTAWVLAGRGAQGLAGAFVVTSALSMVTSIFEQGPPRNRALAIWGALTGAAATIAVILGGILTEGPGWRWIFGINVPVGLVAIAMAWALLPKGASGTRPQLDLPGAVLLTGGLLTLIVGIARAETVGWLSTATFTTIGLAIVVLLVFVSVERRTSEPLIDFAVLRIPTLRGANVVAFLVYGAMFAMYYVLSLLMQRVFGWSALQTGIAYVPLGLFLMVGSKLAQSLLSRLPARLVVQIALALGVVAMALMARVPTDASYLIDVLVPFLLIGLAFGLVVVVVQVLAFTGVQESVSGVAAGIINTTQEFGGALGTAVLSTLAASVTAAAGGREADLAGYHVALLAVGGLLVLAAGAAALMFRTPAAPSDVESVPDVSAT